MYKQQTVHHAFAFVVLAVDRHWSISYRGRRRRDRGRISKDIRADWQLQGAVGPPGDASATIQRVYSRSQDGFGVLQGDSSHTGRFRYMRIPPGTDPSTSVTSSDY